MLSYDIANWRDRVLEIFPDEFISIEEFAGKWVNLLLDNSRLIKLFTILYTLLEQNASLEALIGFKQKMVVELETVSERLTKVLPFASLEAVSEFLTTQTALTLGSYPMINLAPKQKQAMDTVGMDSNPETFKGMLIHATESLLRGLAEETA